MLTEHRREYDEDRDIPPWLKWTLASINRVGFPIVAFILMWWMTSNSISKVTEALNQNTLVLMEVKEALVTLHSIVLHAGVR